MRRDWNPPLSQNIEDRRNERPYVPDWTERGRNGNPTPREILEQKSREDTPNPYWTPRLPRQSVPEMARGGSVKRSARRGCWGGSESTFFGLAFNRAPASQSSDRAKSRRLGAVMSALNVIKQRDRVIVVTDGAAWDMNTGVIQAFPTKQATMPSLSAVFATRGTPMATPLFGFLIGFRFSSFDDMVVGIEDEIRNIHEQVKAMCSTGFTDGLMVIAGWSHDRDRAEAYVIQTNDDAFCATLEETEETTARAIQSPPYKLHPIRHVMYAPFTKAYEQVGIRDDMDEAALLRAMTALLELQRKNLFRSPKGEPFSAIGGYALATIVTADSIRQKVFHRWPQDRVGKRIAIASSTTTEPVSEIICGANSLAFMGTMTDLPPSDEFDQSQIYGTSPQRSERMLDTMDPNDRYSLEDALRDTRREGERREVSGDVRQNLGIENPAQLQDPYSDISAGVNNAFGRGPTGETFGDERPNYPTGPEKRSASRH